MDVERLKRIAEKQAASAKRESQQRNRETNRRSALDAKDDALRVQVATIERELREAQVAPFDLDLDTHRLGLWWNGVNLCQITLGHGSSDLEPRALRIVVDEIDAILESVEAQA